VNTADRRAGPAGGIADVEVDEPLVANGDVGRMTRPYPQFIATRPQHIDSSECEKQERAR
jgi:hypothetical protein